MGIKLTFEIELKSDYHVGVGYGKGFNVDSAILREAGDAPVIRGSALAGLLRDGAYRLFRLPPLQKYEWDQVEGRVFGSPAKPKRWHIASARPVNPLSKGRDSQAVQHVRIDPRTRRAAPRKLFSQEEGAGQAFKFTITCPNTDESAWDEAALLVAAARNVRQLGRSRRRGLGECLFRLIQVEGVSAKAADWQKWFLTRFKERWVEGQPAEPERDQLQWTMGERTVPMYSKEPVRRLLIVHLDEPLVIARRAPAGQQFEARESIPGTVILGALANEAAHRQNLTDPETYARFIALFVRGGVMFPTLYPADESNGDIYPAIPAPLGLLTCDVLPFQGQDEGHGLHLGIDGHQGCVHDNCTGKLRPIKDFLPLSDDPPYTHPVRKSSELHIKVNAETGRVEEGQLYGYTVLDAGQYFVGELQCADENAWNHLCEMTGIAERTAMEWRLGKARRRGYGKVTAWLKRCDDEEPLWIQLPLEERVTDIHQRISLTLLTDAIIQNRWGQQAVGFAEDWLEETLGLGKVEIVDAYVRSRTVDSFNSHLGLPGWRDTALAAGSVVWFTLKEPPDDWQERLDRLEREGIGLRRNEGFGRVAFNHPIYDQRDRLTESNIWLDEVMRPEERLQGDKFVTEWKETLDERFLRKLDSRFGSLARWLHTHSEASPTWLLEQWGPKFNDKGECTDVEPPPDSIFGEPDSALIDAIGGESEYGARSKENFFLAEGKETVKKICETIKILESESEQHWPDGIRLLADRLASLAGDEKGGTE